MKNYALTLLLFLSSLSAWAQLTATPKAPTVSGVYILGRRSDGVLIERGKTGSATPIKLELFRTGSVNVTEFGAIGDSATLNNTAIISAITSSATTIIFPKGVYLIDGLLFISIVRNKTLQFLPGAKVLNINNTPHWLFQNSSNITISGGEFGLRTMPTANGGGNQHVFQFDRCQDVTVSGIHILNSSEMGIATTSCNRVTIQDSRIEHTFRDGTYSHYSANVSYLRNTYSHIKDDAMSFHDYGQVSEKSKLLSYGYSQAGNFLAENNIVDHAYQGLSSIGSTGVRVLNNTFQGTVLASISVWNSRELYTPGDALVSDVIISGNKSYSACSTTTINMGVYANNGQSGAGSAAIFVGSLGSNNQLNGGETKRLSRVTVTRNEIYNSGAAGMLAYMIDNFTNTGNSFYDCAGQTSVTSGDVVNLINITGYYESDLQVTDTRTTPLHKHGLASNSVTGLRGTRKVSGTLQGEEITYNAVPGSALSMAGAITRAPGYINSAGPTSFNQYTDPAVWMVTGSGWGAPNGPSRLGNAGNLIVYVSDGVITQQYFDNQGNSATRTIFDYKGAGTWSAWQYTFVPLTKAGLPTTAEVPVDCQRIVINSSAATVRLYFNAAGTLWYTDLTH